MARIGPSSSGQSSYTEDDAGAGLCRVLARSHRPGSGGSPMNSRWIRNSFIYLIMLVAVVLVVIMFFRPSSSSREIALSEVIAEAQQGNVASIEVNGDKLTIQLRTQQADFIGLLQIGYILFA